MSEYNIKELKSGGLMKQKEKDLFSLRLRIVGGFVKSEQLIKLSEIANKFGKGYLHLTTRQGIEIPHVNFKDFEKVKGELGKVELQMGACGQRVRTVTACQGKECSHGLIDCLSLAREIDNKYFGIGGHPHKFKIGITGCPNACIKPHENDLGILGMLKKKLARESCNYCGLCAEVCPVGAIEIDRDNEKIMFYENKIIRQPLFSQAKIRILQSLGLTTASSGLFTLLRNVIRDRGKRSEKNKPNITLFMKDSIVAGEGKSDPISFALQTTHPK